MPAPIIFICYASPDRRVAEHIHRALDARGMHPWCDAIDLVPGQKWDEVIPGVLKRAAAVLVLITDSWPEVGDNGDSWYGPEEVALAIEQARWSGTLIVPARLDGVGPERLPYGLRRLSDIEANATNPHPIVEGLTRTLERRARALASPEVPALNQRLAEAQARITTLEARGAEPAEIEAAITAKIDIQRSLRAGGRLQAGDMLARYVLGERLGQGGFASVWRAWDPTHRRHVAIKVLHARWNADASRIERFHRGARQMARLDHPAVVPVLDPECEDNGWRFFVMAWMPGGDLHRAITRDDDPLSADAGLRAVLEVAEALGVAHRRGVVHRDVKPQNILLDADGRAKLSDFDLVRAHDTSGGTGTGAMGTFMYAAPEQLDRPQDVGPRTDVYALGMTAVFVLTGRRPETTTKWQPKAAVARLPATAQVREVLERAIALREAERPADAVRFAAEMRAAMVRRIAWAQEVGGADAETGRPQTRASADAADPDRRRLIEPAPDARVADIDTDAPSLTSAARALPATGLRPALVSIEPGEFVMGSPESQAGRVDEERPHRVKLARGFLMAETEVTQAQYAALMGRNPSYFQGTEGDGARPVEQVSWVDAARYCNALSAKEGLSPAYTIEGDAVTWDQDAAGYRLPTEAEWEYAARAGTAAATYAGDLDIVGKNNAPVLDAIAWYGGNSGANHPKAIDSSAWPEKQYPHQMAATQPVKGKRPNRWGLYDMLGNVWEWTWDWHDAYPSTADGAPRVDPAGPPRGVRRVFRGGSFDGVARFVRAAVRGWWPPEYRVRDLGFRPVRFAGPPPRAR